MSTLPAAPPTGIRKAAILLVTLGDDAAVAVIRRLARPAVEQIAHEISQMAPINPVEALAVLDEYHRASLNSNPMNQGGPEAATSLLVQAFGEREAGTLLTQVKQAEAPSEELEALRAEPGQLAKLLQAEHPQTIAVLLAHVGSKTSSQIVAQLPEEVRAEAVKRLAAMKQYSPDLAARIARVLRAKLTRTGEHDGESYSGLKTVAEILNRTDKTVSQTVLDGIEQSDPALALSIRNSMFTFEDMISVPVAGLREWLAQMDKRALALALKGAKPDLRTHLLSAMSSRAAEMLNEDMEALGPTRASDVLQAQAEAVALARRLEAEGKMVLRPDQTDEFLV